MKVSVIMPLYNQSKYVEEAIQSVINQTHKDWELIIVDDGSTDVWEEPLHGKIDVITLKRNRGIAKARNVGVKYANYDLIAFLSADDIWKPNFLEEMIRHYKEGIIFCDYNIINQKGVFLKKFLAFPERKRAGLLADANMLIKSFARQNGMFINYSCIMGEKKLFVNNPFWLALRFGEDFHHLLSICDKTKFFYVPEALVDYRWHEENATHKHLKEINDNNKRIFVKLRSDGVKI